MTLSRRGDLDRGGALAIGRFRFAEPWLAGQFPDAHFEWDPNDALGQSVVLVHGGVRHVINQIRPTADIIAEVESIIRTDAVMTRMCCDLTPLGAHLEDVTELGPYYVSKPSPGVRLPAGFGRRWAEKYIL